MPSKSTAEWDEPISIDAAAALLGVTSARVRQLVASGHIERIGRGKTTAGSAARGMARFWEERAADGSKSAADNRVREARAVEIERRMAREDREIIALDEAVAVVEDLTAEFVGIISGLPSQITRDIHERRRIEAICDAERRRLGRNLVESRRTLQSGEASSSARGEEET